MSYNTEGDKLRLTPVESGICETGIRETAEYAEFRYHKTPDLPCQPEPPKSPPCREDAKKREIEARGNGDGSSGKETWPSGPKEKERNLKETRIGRRKRKGTSTQVR